MRESKNIFSFQDGSNRENEFFRNVISGIENYEKLWDMPLDEICYSQSIILDPDYKPNFFSDAINYLSKKISNFHLYSISSDLLHGRNSEYRLMLSIISRFYFKRDFGANTCCFVSRYINSRMKDCLFLDDNNLQIHRRLLETGKEQFKTCRDVPSGILEFSEALDNRIPMQVNLTDDDLENNGIWRFYVRFSEERDIFHLRNLCCYLLPDSEITRLAFELNRKYDAECVKDQISILRKRLSAFVSNRKNGLFSVAVAEKKEDAASMPPPYLEIRQTGYSYDRTMVKKYKKDFLIFQEDNPPYQAVEYPLSNRINAERLVHLLYFDYLVYKILNAINAIKKDELETDWLNRTKYPGMNRRTKQTEFQSRKLPRRMKQEQENDRFCLFIPELASSNPVSSGIVVSTSGKISEEMLSTIEIITSQLFKPAYIAALIDSSILSNIKTAVGAVMSRNGSHNIGSHVLSALSHQIGIMPDDRIFYQYIQQRMGYIANVTTDFPGWTTSTMFVGDMMRTFFSQYHLLEHIADSEGLHAYRFRDSNGVPYPDEEQSETIKIWVRRVDYDKDVKVTHFVSFFNCKPETTASNSLEQDVALAIPGGIVGQHAFFTILENIIRNAAKHGWATKKQNDRKAADNPDFQYDANVIHREEAPKNLEIHISFRVKKDDDTIEFTIWDNVSDVLLPLFRKGGTGIDPKKVWTFLRTLSEVEDENSPSFSFPSDKFPNKTAGSKDDALLAILSETGRITRKKWIKEYFPELPKEPVSFDDFLNDWVESTKSVFFDHFLYKTPQNEHEIRKLRSIDYKSCVPLHMQQEILLAQPLIDENGELQRENWGMAEMKISAGYLRNFSVEQIGGMKPIESDDYIIRAIAVRKRFSCPRNLAGDLECSDPTSCENRSSCSLRNDYHLGYRFKIRKNREMLIVLKKEDADLVQGKIESCMPVFKQEGVYFATRQDNDIVCLPVESCDTVNDFNYDYIVFPSENDAKDSVPDQEHWLSYFPFRLLVGGKENTRQTGGPKSIAYNELIETLSGFSGDQAPLNISSVRNMVFSLKNIVYRDWLEDLKTQYSDEPLHMFIKTDDDQKSTNYLFQDYDLYQYLFQSFWDPEKVAGMFMRARMKEASQSCGKGHMNSNGPIMIDDKLFRFRPETIKPDDLKNCVSNISGSICAIIHKILDAVPQETKCKEKDNIILELTNAMENKYRICDSLLRGNHNSCITLPDVFISEESHPNIDQRKLNANPGLDSTLIIYTNKEYANTCNIKYQRHLVASSMYSDCIYAEQLSGMQSFFSMLNNYMCNLTAGDARLFVRMAENALLRILIIDERVSKFLTNHPCMRTVFLNMNISATDFSETKNRTKDLLGIKEDDFDIDLEKLPLFPEYPEGHSKTMLEKKWDILIIHQGVIDKWFSRHSKTEVGKLIGNLQNKVMYPVITSGRGRPDNIPEHIKVLPFSVIESTLFSSCPEKILLTSTIMNLLPLS